MTAEPGDSSNSDDEPDDSSSEGDDNSATGEGAPGPQGFGQRWNLFPDVSVPWAKGLSDGILPDFSYVTKNLQSTVALYNAHVATGLAHQINSWFPADYFSSIFADIYEKSGLLKSTADLVRSITGNLGDLADVMRGMWPANLSGLSPLLDVDKMKALMMDEGLPIAWVPRQETVRMVLEATSPAQRRAIYGRRWRGIVTDCEQLVNRMSATATSGYVRFLRAIIASLRDGHYESAQALAATTLDTAILDFYGDESRRKWIGTNKRIEPEELSIRQFFVVSQLWGIHRQYKASNGDRLPGTFNRHGSCTEFVTAVQPTQRSPRASSRDELALLDRYRSLGSIASLIRPCGGSGHDRRRRLHAPVGEHAERGH